MPRRQQTPPSKPFDRRAHWAPRLEALPPAYFFAPDVEREINRLENVTAAKVLSNGTGIDEIHVVTSLDRSPKKTVRDIESLLMVRFGIRIDHRCISIVQMEGPQSAYSPSSNRPQIKEVSRAEGALKLTLAVGNSLIEGRAQADEGESELRAMGRAAIHAIEQLLKSPGALTIVNTHVAELSGNQAVVVLVQWAFGEQQELLIGSSLVRDDPLEAMARATLDAVNRRVVRFQAA